MGGARIEICPVTARVLLWVATHNVYYVKSGAMSDMFMSSLSH